MSQITIPPDQPDASFGTMGSQYFGIYRMPHGRWRQLLGPKKERLYFASAQEATRAAFAEVNRRLFGKITAEREPDEAKIAAALDVPAWREKRGREAREHRKVFRGAGKGFVPVEVVKRRGA